MKSPFTIITLFAIAFLVVTVCGEADGPPEDELVFGDGENDSTPVIIATTVSVSKAADDTIATTPVSDINTTANPVTSAANNTESSTNTTSTSNMQSTTSSNDTTPLTTVTETPTTTSSSTNVTVPTTTTTTVTPSTTTQAPQTTTQSTGPTTTVAPGRKFDGLSFLGGIILAVGIGALAFLVARYVRRSNRVPYANLQ